MGGPATKKSNQQCIAGRGMDMQNIEDIAAGSNALLRNHQGKQQLAIDLVEPK